MKRLGIEDLTDEHLRLLVEAEKVSVVANARAWLEEVARGGPLELWECPGGIAGFRKEPERLWIELIAGQGLINREFIQWLRLEAAGRPLEGLVTNQRLLPLYRRLGAEQIGVYMRWKP